MLREHAADRREFRSSSQRSVAKMKFREVNSRAGKPDIPDPRTRIKRDDRKFR